MHTLKKTTKRKVILSIAIDTIHYSLQ
jgi:hypothetical protein